MVAQRPSFFRISWRAHCDGVNPAFAAASQIAARSSGVNRTERSRSFTSSGGSIGLPRRLIVFSGAGGIGLDGVMSYFTWIL